MLRLKHIFFLIAAVMGIADSLPDMFCTAKAILIIFGVSIIFFLIAFFNIRKRLRYSKLEPFKEIQYIVPCVLQQVYIRRSKQEGYDKVDIVPQGGGNVYTYDWKRSYRTRFKIKINSKRMKPGMTGYVVGYTNQFNNDNEEFVIFG